MSNTQRNTETTVDDSGPDETFIVYGPRPNGFTILYNEAALLLLPEHAMVYRCYMALCIMSNGQRKGHPSRQTLAKVMGIGSGQAVSLDSVDRAVKRLEVIGLLHVRRPETPGRGKANEYTLTLPENSRTYAAYLKEWPQGDQGIAAPAMRLLGEEKAAPAMRPQQETSHVNNNLQQPTSRARARDEDGVPLDFEDGEERLDEVGSSAPIPQGQPSGNLAQSNSNANHRSVHSNGNSALDREMAMEYWQGEAGEERRKSLSAIYQKYPKPGDRLPVAQAYREVIGEYADSSREDGIAFYKHVWHRLHDWMEHWQKEQTPDQYIPYLTNWLRKEKFNEVPGVRRK